jgi:hypothetical protein
MKKLQAQEMAALKKGGAPKSVMAMEKREAKAPPYMPTSPKARMKPKTMGKARC